MFSYVETSGVIHETSGERTYHTVITSIQLKLKVAVGVCNYVIFLANIFK